MNWRPFLVIFLCVAACLPLSLTDPTAEGADARAKAPGPKALLPWQCLVFEASGTLIKIEAKVGLAPAGGRCPLVVRAAPGFMDCPLHHPDALLLTVNTHISGLLAPEEHYEHRIWFDPETLAALQRSRWKQGAKGWLKLYRWRDDGVERIKLKPGGQEQEGPDPAGWSRMTRDFYPYPAEADACGSISEPALLLYILSILPAGQGQDSRTDLCLFGKKQLHLARIEQLQTGREPAAFSLLSAGMEHKVKGRVNTVLYRISATALPYEKDRAERFSLLGLEGKIEILVDLDHRLPLSIKGSNPLFGHLELQLKRAEIP